MTTSKRNRRLVVTSALAITLSTLAGCDSSPTSALPPAPTPVANPSADNKLNDVTLENESANMDRIKKAGEGR